MANTQRVIITGGPGTGKSSILHELEKMGFPVHQEIARAVIKRHLEAGNDLLPWKDLGGFSDVVFNGQKSQYREAQEGRINFYDRGMVDVVAYLRKDSIPATSLEDLLEHYPYHPTVFMTPPWPDIYTQDVERREDEETMHAIHNSLVDTYSEFGYEVLEVPKISLGDRVDFILNQLGLK